MLRMVGPTRKFCGSSDSGQFEFRFRLTKQNADNPVAARFLHIKVSMDFVKVIWTYKKFKWSIRSALAVQLPLGP